MALIALHNCGESYSQTFKLLKPLKVSRMYIFQAIKHYEELWWDEDRAQSGPLKSSRPEAAIKTVWERIHRNLPWKQNILSQEMSISTRSMSSIIRDDLHMSAHHCSKGHILTPAVKAI